MKTLYTLAAALLLSLTHAYSLNPDQLVNTGCTDPSAINFDDSATEDDGSCVVPPCSDEVETLTYCYENDDESTFVFTESTPGNGVILQFLQGEMEAGWDSLGFFDANLTLITTLEGDLTGEIISTSTAFLTVQVYSDFSISCSTGSQDPFTVAYYCSSLAFGGCTDDTACNYDEQATEDNGNCVYTGDTCDDSHSGTTNDMIQEDCSCAGEFSGCTDSLACNFNELASQDDDSCQYSGDTCDDNNESTVNDVLNENCLCAGQAGGCTDSTAVNYNENAIEDNGSCCYANSIEVILTDSFGDGGAQFTLTDGEENSVSQGSLDDGFGPVSFTTCLDNPSCLVFELAAEDFFEGEVSVEVIINGETAFIHNQGDSFDQYQIVLNVGDDPDCVIPGCTDPNACNFFAQATEDNGSCILIGATCDDLNASTLNDVIQADCSCSGEFGGCIDNTACNFAQWATIDDGSCQYPGDSCDDNNEDTTNDVLNVNCNCAGQEGGCTDSSAVNYDELALEDDGSCCYTNSIEVTLYDSFGDGGASFTLHDNQNNLVNEGLLADGFGPSSFTTCIDNPTCLIFSLGFDAFPFEIFADVHVNGELVYSHVEGDDFEQYPLVINIGDNPECIIYGCTDSTACNYSGLATEDDGTCDFASCVGCSSFGAANYDEEVTIDDGSCYWEAAGAVFIDDNYNGILDPFETPLPYQQVTLEPGGLTVITDDNGMFSFSNLDQGTYTVSSNYSAEWTNYTTAQEQTMNFPQNGGQTMSFGVTNEATPSPSACVDFYQWGFGVPCNDVLNFNVCYRNMSPYPISGTVVVELDPLVSYSSSYPSDVTVDGNTISWDFTNLGSWVMNFDDLVINTPDETHIGEFMTNHVTIYAEWEGELIPLTEQSITQEVTCAYDPNDITGYPLGYTNDHLVLPDTRMEYLIRFQNTGNAPAGTVRVVDTLDVDMNWDSFELIANSHSVMTTIDQESGEVEFLFENINLPDSVENEPESHGMVSFKIDFADGTPIGEEINQTAYIYFDNNPPVITNTTWHTLHQCGGEGAFEASATQVCAGDEVSFTSTYPLVEDYQWNLDAAPVGNESVQNQQFTEPGEYIVQLVSENPICADATSQIITVYDLPTAEVMENGAILTASSGESYQWFLNDELIEGATDQTYEAIEDGTYHVVVTNENDCSQQSAEVMIVNVSELLQPTIVLYPNPMTSVAMLQIETSEKKTVTLTDSQGRTVRNWENITDQSIEIQKGELASGTYYVNVLFADGQLKTMALIMR